jgi:serine palmitoyltransferase
MHHVHAGFVHFRNAAIQVPVVENKAGNEIIIDGMKCWNLATHNYLGFAGNEEVEEAAVKSIQKFGVGSCGPRAFYGTAGNQKHQF